MTHRLGLALEYTLGNATHADNIKRVAEEDPAVRATCVDLNPFAPIRWPATLPGIRRNWQLRASLEAYLALRGRRLDAAFFHTHSTALLSTGLMHCVPSVLSLDSTRLQLDAFGAYYWANPNPNPRVKAINKRMYQRAYRASRHLVAMSQWVKESLVSDYGVPEDKVSVVAPGIDTDFFRPDSAARVGDGVARVLFVGGDFERKGGDLLLRWARERAGGAWELHVVTRDEVPATPGVVVHHGITGNSPQLARLYQQSDVFALPTRADCFSHVAIEAMACGLPVVITHVGGIADIVVEGETGFLMEPDDYPGLAARLDMLVSDAGLRRQMGLAGRQRAAAEFGLNNYTRLVGMLLEMAR